MPWACEVCTYENDSSRLKCEMCETPFGSTSPDLSKLIGDKTDPSQKPNDTTSKPVVEGKEGDEGKEKKSRDSDNDTKTKDQDDDNPIACKLSRYYRCLKCKYRPNPADHPLHSFGCEHFTCRRCTYTYVYK